MLGIRHREPTAVVGSATGADPRAAPRAPQDLASLYDAHGPGLFSLACLLLDDREEAEAAVTHVLLDARNRRRAGAGGQTRRNLARCVYLRCTRTRLGPHRMPHSLPSRQEATDSHQPAIVRGLHELSDQQRGALALCLFGDHTCDDVADVMSLPPQVISELLRSGLLRLRAAQREAVS